MQNRQFKLLRCRGTEMEAVATYTLSVFGVTHARLEHLNKKAAAREFFLDYRRISLAGPSSL